MKDFYAFITYHWLSITLIICSLLAIGFVYKNREKLLYRSSK